MGKLHALLFVLLLLAPAPLRAQEPQSRALATALVACDDDGDPVGPINPDEGVLTVDATEDWAFVRLGETATEISVSDPSSSEAWDIGFFATAVMLNGGGAGPGGIFNIGKSRATLFDKGTKVNITFADVAGLDGDSRAQAIDAGHSQIAVKEAGSSARNRALTDSYEVGSVMNDSPRAARTVA